jgi:hypothetical protein
LGEDESHPFIRKALEAGINFSDTANRYARLRQIPVMLPVSPVVAETHDRPPKVTEMPYAGVTKTAADRSLRFIAAVNKNGVQVTDRQVIQGIRVYSGFSESINLTGHDNTFLRRSLPCPNACFEITPESAPASTESPE